MKGYRSARIWLFGEVELMHLPIEICWPLFRNSSQIFERKNRVAINWNEEAQGQQVGVKTRS